jgi:hypothetical protein
MSGLFNVKILLDILILTCKDGAYPCGAAYDDHFKIFGEGTPKILAAVSVSDEKAF